MIPVLNPPTRARFRIEGIIGDRLQANVRQWLLVAPDANPAMLEIFRDRDRLPRRDLVPWAGEFAGKYLTSAVLTLRLTQDDRLRDYLARFVATLIDTQDSDGYLGPFPRSARLMGPGLWDIWGHYHCMLGLYLWHIETGDPAALEACLRGADLLCNTFLDGSRRVVQAGSEEMNESVIHVLCLLYQHTGRERYLRLAREIEQDWQTPPSGDYIRTALAGVPFHQCPKPRWEGLHGIQAIAELHFITGQPHYREAFEHIWWSIAEGDRHNTGGFSSGEQATGNPYDPRAIETCCTIAWMAISVDMLRLTGNPRVADELELSLFNAVLGAQNETGRWWTYNTPMDGERKASAHDIVFQARAGSPELNCCSVNGPRGLGMLADWAFMETSDGLALNYYGPCEITARIPGTDCHLTLRQETTYPRQGSVKIHMAPSANAQFSLRLRIPGWSARTHVSLNGEALDTPASGSYLELTRRWQAGDVIDIDFDFSMWHWTGERECAGKVSLYRGPILLAYDPRFDQFSVDELPALALDALQTQSIDWQIEPKPVVLEAVATIDGRVARLCDFATAGAAGTRYITWLPAESTPAAPFSRDNPLRAAR